MFAYHPAGVRAQITRDSLTYTLSVSGGLTIINVENYHQSRVIDILLPQSHRIKRLKVFGLNYESFLSLLTLPAPSFEYLEEIDVKVDSSQSEVRNHPITALCGARNLMKLHLNLGIDTIRTESLLLPWGNLTDLEMVNVSSLASTIHHILGQSHSLIRATFQINNNSDTITVDTPIGLHHLEETSFLHREPVD
jgi:hypothetical protein